MFMIVENVMKGNRLVVNSLTSTDYSRCYEINTYTNLGGYLDRIVLSVQQWRELKDYMRGEDGPDIHESNGSI